MRFSLSSFVLGWMAGVATASMGRRLRPVLVELAAAGYRMGEGVASRFHVAREDAEDLLAEGRLRSRKPARTAPAGRRATKRSKPSRMNGSRSVHA